MIREGRIKSCCWIKSLLQIDQVTVFLDRAEESQVALNKLAKYILRHIHVRSEKLHTFIQHYAFPVEIPQRHTIFGSISSSIKSDIMILLNAQLFYFLLKIRIVTLIKNCQPMRRCNITIFGSWKHIQVTISMSDTETSVVIDTRFTGNAFLCCNINNAGSTTRTILSSFGSIFQDGKALYIRRINRSKHT